MAYIVASNLINRSPDTLANARALERLDFVVVHEPFMTPTARCADLLLPICTDLERADLVTAWAHDLRLFDSRQAVEPAGEARTDYWVFAQLAERLGLGDAYTGGQSEAEWMARFLRPHRHGTSLVDVASLEQEGIVRHDPEPRVALADFRADPATHPLPTRSGRIEIVNPEAEAYGLPPIPSYVAIAPDEGGYPLQLVTPHHKHRSNSCLDGVPSLKRLDPQAVWMNPADAAARGIADGERVEVYNGRGTVRLPARVTARIMPGVACIYQGAWYRPGPDGVDEGGCANVLTAQHLSPSGGPATHTAWVEIRAAPGAQAKDAPETGASAKQWMEEET
jgi:anaerobic dimethyl sulfoxide reductase subunit A